MTSIYSGARFRPSDVQVEDVAAHAPERPGPMPRGRVPVELRRAAPANTLFANTVHWILALPLAYRPLRLSRQFPRIANQLHLTWNDPASCRAYFEDLLLDRRGNRKGFPLDVLLELEELQSYHESISPDSLRLDDIP